MMNINNLCKDCKNFTQILQQRNLKHYWQKRCTVFDCRLLPAKKKCNGKYFETAIKTNNTMKVVKMTDWNDAYNFPMCQDQKNFKDFWNCVRKFIKEKNIKFNGSWHQNWDYGVPIIEYDGKLYAFAISMRRWGLIISEAFYPENKDSGAYLDWAFSNPDGVKTDIDENKDPLLSTEGI